MRFIQMPLQPVAITSVLFLDTMTANTVAPNVARPSTALELITSGPYVVAFHDDGFQFRGVNAE